MKKIIIALLVMALCLTMVCPALADEGDFVPSITYKPMPEFSDANTDEVGQIVGQTRADADHTGDVYLINGELFVIAEGVHETAGEYDHPCLVITPLSEATTSTEIPDESEERLLWVYEQILTEGMDFFEDCEGLNELIAANLGEGKTVQDLVVKELFDVSVLCDPLESWLEPTGTTLCLDFDAHVAPGTFVTVLTYKGGQWKLIEDVKVLEDGSVTCDTFENFCPVAILAAAPEVAPEVEAGTIDNGDLDTAEVETTGNLGLWLAVAAASLIAVVLIVAGLAKKKKSGVK